MSTTDLSSAKWRTSSRSNGKSNCVEVADLDLGHHAVRDSKNPAGPALIVTTAEWSTFTTGIHAGEFD
ncbi:MAG: DUF397 domain-containing protein [Pseudonocardiaceae bacterium]